MTTNTFFGSSDLDLRPARMQRDTMHVWVQECPGCHLVSSDLSYPEPDAVKTIARDDYQALIEPPLPKELAGLPELANRLLRNAMFFEQDEGKFAQRVLRAAWDCDDHGLTELANTIRKRAANSLQRLAPFNQSSSHNSLGVLLTDILRRSGQFEKAIEHAAQMEGLEAVQHHSYMLKVLAFQKQLCADQDAKVYTLDQAGSAS